MVAEKRSLQNEDFLLKKRASERLMLVSLATILSDTLDWERFDTNPDAEVSAKKLVQSCETYTIEEHNGDCPRCRDGVIFFTPEEWFPMDAFRNEWP
jgi:uncharacterized paraquat-inducible protein A